MTSPLLMDVHCSFCNIVYVQPLLTSLPKETTHHLIFFTLNLATISVSTVLLHLLRFVVSVGHQDLVCDGISLHHLRLNKHLNTVHNSRLYIKKRSGPSTLPVEFHL